MGVECAVIVAIAMRFTCMIVMIAVIVVIASRFLLMGVITVIMLIFGGVVVIVGAGLGIFAQDCAGLMQKLHLMIRAQLAGSVFQPDGHFRSHPDQQFGLLQGLCLTWAQLEVMRIAALVQQRFGVPQIAQYLRHQRSRDRHVGHDAGRLCRRRKGKKGEAQQNMRAHGGSFLVKRGGKCM